MATDKLTGNMPTEKLVAYFEECGVDLGLNQEAFRMAQVAAGDVFGFVKA
jgi:hydroxymethylglutaryl-CoA lyase